MTITVVYITARPNPRFDWMLDSLRLQVYKDDDVRVVLVDLMADERKQVFNWPDGKIALVTPKPSVWQGKHRLTKEDWWAASNSRNTGICLCRTDWIAFLDDRCVLLPGWLNSIKEAQAGNYAVFGAYEKREGMEVSDGKIVNEGKTTGKDHRESSRTSISVCGGGWAFGCNLAMPIEMALAVNGYDETCDSLGMEDCLFGLMLQNNGFKLMFDPRMKIIEDRSGSLDHSELKTVAGSKHYVRATDKGKSPNDKSHALLFWLRGLKSATHQWNIRSIRESVLAGNSFPVPVGPTTDWYDGQLISEM